MTITYPDKQLASKSSKFFLEDGIDFKKLFEQLYKHVWIILAVSVFTCFITFLYTFTITPQYETSALLQMHMKSNSFNILSKLGDQAADSQLDTQEALIKTRYILEPTIIQTNLNISISPHYFPIFGAWMARHHNDQTLAKPFLGLKSYAWGGEKIIIKQFIVPPESVGQNFKLVAEQANVYKLYSSEGKLILTGKVGEQTRSLSDNRLILELSSLNARPGTEFFLGYQAPIFFVQKLARKIQISDVFGDDPTQTTGIFQVKLTDNDPEQAVQILNAIVNNTIAKNAKQNLQETQASLDFLQHRLPEVKTDLAMTENAINQFRMKNYTISMSMTGEVLERQLLGLEQTLEKLHAQKMALLQIYTLKHPYVIDLINREVATQESINDLKAKIQKFPFENQTELNLLRDAKIKNVAYLNLLNNQQQLELLKASAASDIVLLSDAMPAVRVPVHKGLIVLAGFLVGAFFSSMLIILINAFNKTVEDADQLEEMLNIPVRSVVPFSRKQKQMEKSYQRSLKTFGTGLSSVPLILAKQEPDDITVESLRSLRISLQIMSPPTGHTVMAILGSMSDIGKSFISLNLAQVFADFGQRVLLIDADIRRGRLHQALHLPRSKGLSEYLEGTCDYKNLIRPIHENLYFIPNGVHKEHPLKLFQNPRFQDLMQQTKKEFNHIIIDTPPVLPVIDSMLIAPFSDIKLFVVSAGKDTVKDVEQAINKTHAHDIEVNGFVLNHRQSIIAANSAYRYAYTDALETAR